MAPNKGFFLRSLDHISYAISSTLVGLFLSKPDRIIASSPQFFTALSGYALSLFKGCKWVFEVRDIWPQAMILFDKKDLVFKILEEVEKFLYKKADKIVVVTNSFKKDLISRCNIEPDKISVIFNGTSVDKNIDFSERETRNLQKDLIVGYAGTIGVSQGFKFLLDEINKLKEEAFRFIFLGDGVEVQFIKEKIKEFDLKKIEILNSVERRESRKVINQFDIGLVPLRKFEPYKKVIPSKIFDLAGQKIPILLGVEGEAAKLVKRYQIGETYLPEDSDSFRFKLKELKEKLHNNKHIYIPGFDEIIKDFSHEKLALRYLEVLKII